MLKMNGQSKNTTVFLSSRKADIFDHSFSLPDIQYFNSQLIPAEAADLVASPTEIADNTEAQC